MLISIDSGKRYTTVPHAKEYQDWMRKLSDAERQSIFAELETKISGDEVHTSSWMPGSDWRGTVFQPIYEKACNRNPDAAALCFGLVVWETFMNHSDTWSFGRYEKNGIPIKGLTYFRLHPSAAT